MGDAAGQRADSLHAFRFLNLFLETFLFGNISENALDGDLILKGDHRGGYFGTEGRAVFTDHPVNLPVKFHKFALQSGLDKLTDLVMGFGTIISRIVRFSASFMVYPNQADNSPVQKKKFSG